MYLNPLESFRQHLNKKFWEKKLENFFGLKDGCISDRLRLVEQHNFLILVSMSFRFLFVKNI